MITLYLLYLVLAAFFMLFYGKIPKIYQLLALVGLTTVLVSHNSLDSIMIAITNFKEHKIGLADLLLTFAYAYLNAWGVWDNNLLNSINNLSEHKIKAISGILVFLGMDLLYLLALTLFISWLIDFFRGTFFYKYKVNLDREHEKEVNLFITLTSLSLAFLIGYCTIGLNGLISTFKLLSIKVLTYLSLG